MTLGYDDRQVGHAIRVECPTCSAVYYLTAPKPNRQLLPVTCLKCEAEIPPPS